MAHPPQRALLGACALVALLLSLAPELRAADLHVPGDHPAIQAAIAAAADGDGGGLSYYGWLAPTGRTSTWSPRPTGRSG